MEKIVIFSLQEKQVDLMQKNLEFFETQFHLANPGILARGLIQHVKVIFTSFDPANTTLLKYIEKHFLQAQPRYKRVISSEVKASAIIRGIDCT